MTASDFQQCFERIVFFISNHSQLSGASRISFSQRFTVFTLKMFIDNYWKIAKVKDNILWLRSTYRIKGI